jgi:hypothetical protein
MSTQEQTFQQIYSDADVPNIEQDTYDNLPEEPVSPNDESVANEVLSNIATVPNDQPHEITEADSTIPPVTQDRETTYGSRLERAARRLDRSYRLREEYVAARSEMNEAARQLIGMVDSRATREEISRRLEEIERRHAERTGRWSDVSTGQWVSTATVPITPTTATVLNETTDSTLSSSSSYRYSINGQLVDIGDLNSYSTVVDKATYSMDQKKIAFDEYLKSPDRITSKTIIEYILTSSRIVAETTEKITSYDKATAYPDLVIPILKESEKLLSKLRNLKDVVESMGSGLTSENKKHIVTEISDASSLFFTMAKAWKEKQNRDNYSEEEEEDVGKMLVDYLDLVNRKHEIADTIVKDICERIKSYAVNLCGTLNDNRSALTDRYLELKEKMFVQLYYNTSYVEVRLPMTEYLLWSIIIGNDALKEKYTREDCTRIFKALIRESKGTDPLRPRVYEALSQKIKEIISDKLEYSHSSIIDYKKFLDSPVINAFIKFYSSDETAEALSVSFKVTQEQSFTKYLKPINDRNQLYRFLETEMIRPFQKFNKENCTSLLTGFEAKFNCVTEYPISEVYALIKTLSPLFSFSECRQSGAYIKTMTEDFHFTINIRSKSLRSLKTLQLLNTFFPFVEELDPGSKDFMLNITNDVHCIAVPVEFMIKILGYSRFTRFLNDRRTAEVNALLVALSYKDTFSAQHIPLPGYWDSGEYIDPKRIWGRLMYFLKDGYDKYRPVYKIVHSVPWNKNVLDYIRYKDWKKLDWEDEISRLKKFEDNLERAITEGFQNTFLPTEVDKKFFDLQMRSLLKVYKMISPKAPLRYNSNIPMSRFKGAVLEIVGKKVAESSEHSRAEYYKVLAPVIEKHPIFYPIMTDILNFIRESGQDSVRDFRTIDDLANAEVNDGLVV